MISPNVIRSVSFPSMVLDDVGLANHNFMTCFADSCIISRQNNGILLRSPREDLLLPGPRYVRLYFFGSHKAISLQSMMRRICDFDL